MEKIAQLDPGRSLDFINELSLTGWERTNALRGYVKEVGKGGNWESVVADLEYFENHRGRDGHLRPLSPGTENMIAREWIKEDFEGGLHWFTEEISRDYSQEDDVKNVALVLSQLPEDDRFKVVNWVEEKHGVVGWNDQVAVLLGTHWMQYSPDHHTPQLIGLISGEEDRFQLVSNYIWKTSSSETLALRYSPETLNRLVDAANLTEAKAVELKSAISEGYWKEK